MTYKVKGTCVPVSFLVMGPIDNNVYIVDDGAGCFVVDPTCDADRIVEALDGRKPEAIVLTHGHWDHTGAAGELRETYGAPIVASAVEAPYITGDASFGVHSKLATPCPVDRTVEDGDVVEVGSMQWKVIVTPGHTPGSMCLYLKPAEGQEGAPMLISGDTLFNGAHGRTDFQESIPEAMTASLKRLAELPDDTIVLTGHENLTTIGREKGWLLRGSVFR